MPDTAAMHALIDEQARGAHLLIDSAEQFNSNLTKIIGRDNNGKLLFIVVFARDEEAVTLATQMGEELVVVDDEDNDDDRDEDD